MDFLKRGQGLIGIIGIAVLVACTWPAAPSAAAQNYNWTGIYVGGYAGGAFGSDAKAQDNGGGAFTSWNDGHGHSWRYDLSSSFIGGAQVGYNFQISSIVVGLENEVGYISQTGSRADPVSPNGDTKSSTEVGRWFDVLGGRVGVAFDRWLVYAKGGVAFTRVSSKVVDSCITGLCGTGAVRASGSESVVTGAGGGGAEYAITNNWTYKVEYLFINLDSSFNSSGPATAGGATGTTFNFKHNVNGIHTVKLGVNYKF